MRNHLIVTLCVLQTVCWVVSGVNTFTGYEGGEAKIRCPYSMEYENNPKYLCRGDCPVTNKDIVVRIEDDRALAINGRFALSDNREGREFTVTISGLTHQDSGKYWCAISTGSLKMDVYTEVKLVVDACPTTTCRPPQSPIPPSANTRPTNLQTSPPAGGGMQTDCSTPENSESPPHHLTTHDYTGKLIYLAVGLGVTVLVFALSLFIFITQRKNIRKPMAVNVSSKGMITVDTAEIPEADSEYVELKDSFQQPYPNHNTAPIYCNVNLPKDPADSITYSTVNLLKDPPDSFTYSSVNLPKPSPDSTTYSTVRPS